jgi:hypothetical protein
MRVRLAHCFVVFFAQVVIAVSHAQTPITDMKTLIGRKAVAQRMPFYQPGTYTPIPNTYAGQTVTIIDVKPSAMYAAMPKLTARQMASLPPESRANIENVRNASTIVVQFADGTKADTGAMPVMPTTLASYLEVAPDPQSSNALASNSTANTTPAADHTAIAANKDCPVIVTKATSTNGGFAHALADAMTKSEFERAVEKASAGGNDPHYLDVRMRNASGKLVRAIEAFVTYADAMGDAGPQTTLLTQNDKDIKPGGEYRGYSVDTAQRSTNGIGDVTVFVSRIRYEDNTFWQDNGSRSCALTTRIK